MRPIQFEDGKGVRLLLACNHWKAWPPVASKLNKSPLDLRAEGVITEAAFQAVQVWERVCGLQEMGADKCISCPHVRKVTQNHLGVFLTTLDDSVSTSLSNAVGSKRFREGLKAVAVKGRSEAQIKGVGK